MNLYHNFSSPLQDRIPWLRHRLIGRPKNRRDPAPVDSDVAAQWLRAGASHIISIRQVHETDLLVLPASEFDPPDEQRKADGTVTGSPGLVLRILVADCLPVYFAHEKPRLIALVHAGWRGLASGILTRTIRTLSDLGGGPEGLTVWIGPSIGPCCYEVGKEVIGGFTRPPRFSEGPRGRPMLDLYGSAVDELLSDGVPPASIDRRPPCTKCMSTSLYSHRNGSNQHNLALLQILR